jgi:hypothetical protein
VVMYDSLQSSKEGEERKKCRMVSRGGGLLRGSSALLLEDRGLVLPSLVHIIGEGR